MRGGTCYRPYSLCSVPIVYLNHLPGKQQKNLFYTLLKEVGAPHNWRLKLLKVTQMFRLITTEADTSHTAVSYTVLLIFITKYLKDRADLGVQGMSDRAETLLPTNHYQPWFSGVREIRLIQLPWTLDPLQGWNLLLHMDIVWCVWVRWWVLWRRSREI